MSLRTSTSTTEFSSSLHQERRNSHLWMDGSVRAKSMLQGKGLDHVHTSHGRCSARPTTSDWKPNASERSVHGQSKMRRRSLQWTYVVTRGMAKRGKKRNPSEIQNQMDEAWEGQHVVDRATEGMERAQKALQHELESLRIGRASPAMLEGILVDVYGGQSKLKEIAAVVAKGQQTLGVSVFDPSTLQAVEKAILKSSLGMTPIREADAILVNVPKLSDETKDQLTKIVGKNGEQAKVSVRHARKEAMDAFRIAKEGGQPEDVLKRHEKQVQKLTDEYIHAIEQSVKTKASEIKSAT